MHAMMICPKCLRQYENGGSHCVDDGAVLRKFRDQSSQLLGTTLDGRWRILDKIGEGGMGEVYRARQVNVDRDVAIKVLRIALAATDEYVTRFMREADIASTVQHPHFVSIYDFGQSEVDHLLYIAMELLEGESLAQSLRKRRPTLREIVTIGEQVCAALSAAHERQIIHRDLKPDNIFLLDVPDGPFIKVLDFGIAKDLNAAGVTRTGQLFGTPEYMSPEQCDGGAGVDGRSDLYALGCVLYEVLVAQSPFHHNSVIKTLLAQVSEEPRPFGEVGIAVPPAIEAVVFRLLEKNPDNRYANAVDVRHALKAALEATTPAQEAAYDTMSRSLGARAEGARTVSYGDLAHPLQLEGSLARDAKHELAREADRRRRADAERETASTEKPKSSRWAVAGAVAAAAGLSAAAAGFITTPQSTARATSPAIQIVHAPPQTPPKSAAEEGATALGRRTAIAVTTTSAATAAGFARPAPELATSDVPQAPPPAKTPQAHPIMTIRTPTSVDHAFRRVQGELLGCYESRTTLDEAGSVSFTLAMGQDGEVTSARVVSRAIRSPDTLACMESVARSVKFPAGEAASTYRKTITFSSSKR